MQFGGLQSKYSELKVQEIAATVLYIASKLEEI